MIKLYKILKFTANEKKKLKIVKGLNCRIVFRETFPPEFKKFTAGKSNPFPSQNTASAMTSTLLLFSPPTTTVPKLTTISTTALSLPFSTIHWKPIVYRPLSIIVSARPDFRVWADDGDGDSGDLDDYDMDEEEIEELDNKKDFDVDYDTSLAIASGVGTGLDGDGDGDMVMVQSKSFISGQGWDSEKIVDYRINEEEFHKICLLDCDFFIRKPPDPDNDVYDFREVFLNLAIVD